MEKSFYARSEAKEVVKLMESLKVTWLARQEMGLSIHNSSVCSS